ncbi:MAG: C39 family peptidase [Atribacterota bacterium]
MKILPINVYEQFLAECSVAASSSIANFYNSNINYNDARKIALKISPSFSEEGLYSGDLGLLLNALGFNKVHIITTDVSIFDYSWRRYSKENMKKALRLKIKFLSDEDSQTKLMLKSYIKFLFNKRSNKIIIDYEFDKYIINEIDNERPVLLNFNWNVLFKQTKRSDMGEDDIRGEYTDHSVVVCGYDANGVILVDSHKEKRSLKNIKYLKKGIYKVDWKHIMIAMGFCGDIILAGKFKNV